MPLKAEFIERCRAWHGRWRATNPDHKAGQGPEAFEYEASAGPSESSMAFTIYAIIEEQKAIIWKGFHYWIDKDNKSEYLPRIGKNKMGGAVE
jgi:hypothetical protein